LSYRRVVVIIAGLGGYFNIIGEARIVGESALFIICLKKNASRVILLAFNFLTISFNF